MRSFSFIHLIHIIDLNNLYFPALIVVGNGDGHTDYQLVTRKMSFYNQHLNT